MDYFNIAESQEDDTTPMFLGVLGSDWDQEVYFELNSMETKFYPEDESSLEAHSVMHNPMESRDLTLCTSDDMNYMNMKFASLGFDACQGVRTESACEPSCAQLLNKFNSKCRNMTTGLLFDAFYTCYDWPDLNSIERVPEMIVSRKDGNCYSRNSYCQVYKKAGFW